MYDFFVSHSSKNKALIVENLVNALNDRGYNIWYDKTEILVGDNIISHIKKGLRKSYCIILVVTNDFMESNWTFYETGFFDSMRGNCIIPLLYNVSKSNINKLLNIIGNRKYLDMNETTQETAITELIKILKRTQDENGDLTVVENLKKIQKSLASYETVNSGIISIKLKDYLELFETNKDYLALAAKKIVEIVIKDFLKHKNCTIYENFDKERLIKSLKEYGIGNKNTQEYFEFILSQDCESCSNDMLFILNQALYNILTYYINTIYPAKLSYKQMEVVLPDFLCYSDFESMYEIDKKVMREDLIADTNTTYEWYKYNKYTHIGVRDTLSQKLIGYFSFLPITNETYDQIISGEFKDNEFTSDNMVQYIFSDFYRVYVTGVGIDPIYQNTGAFLMLYNAFIDLILYLAQEREVYISEILAEASTKQGEKFCKMLGMKKISSTSNETDVYRLVTIPPEFKYPNRKGQELYSLCKSKFEEYRDYFENKEL